MISFHNSNARYSIKYVFSPGCFDFESFNSVEVIVIKYNDSILSTLQYTSFSL